MSTLSSLNVTVFNTAFNNNAAADSTFNILVQVREMVEIITREFIQMGGSAGEVWIITK